MSDNSIICPLLLDPAAVSINDAFMFNSVMTRRGLLWTAASFTLAASLGCQNGTNAAADDVTSATSDSMGDRTWWMPDEAEPHARTWMAFGASQSIWGRELLPDVQRNLATLAQTIARYEPVSMLVRERDYDLAQGLVGSTADIELVVTEMDDLWVRDTGPVFVVNEVGEKAAVNLNFNGWGRKQTFKKDRKVADFIARQAGVSRLTTELVLEGGCIEVDGHGTAIITESCVLNRNRNPGISKAQFEAQLMPLLGLDKIIWLPGLRGQDITDGHTDFYARFAGPGKVLVGYEPNPELADHEVTQRHIEMLQVATDAQGNALEVLILEAPQTLRPPYTEDDDFAAGYVGFYLCNGAVLMQEFGDRAADAAAQQVLQSAFPDRAIVALNIDAIAAGGGSIHCATQQEPWV